MGSARRHGDRVKPGLVTAPKAAPKATVHVLESTSNGMKVTACGRTLSATVPTVGRVRILTLDPCTRAVTCKQCIARYAHYFDDPPSTHCKLSCRLALTRGGPLAV